MYLFIYFISIAFIIWSNQIISIQSVCKNPLTICNHPICTQKTVQILSYQNLILNNDKIVELNIIIIFNKKIESVIKPSSDKTLPFQIITICQRPKFLPLIGVKRNNKFQSRNSNRRGKRFNRGGGLQRGDCYPKFGPFNSNPFLLLTLLSDATGILFELIIRIPQIPFIKQILYVLRKLYYLNVMCMNSNSDEKSSDNIKLPNNPIKKTKTTDASLGSKFTLQRSKATKGISKSIHLQIPVKNEDFNYINDQLLNSHECKTNGKYRNCFIKCIPVDKSNGNKSMNHLVNLVGICRNACNSKIESEHDEHLLKTVKGSIVNTDKTVRKRKVFDQSMNENTAPSSTSSSSSSFQNTCDNSSCDANLVPCFKSNTYCVEEKTETSLKFKHEYNLPDYLDSSDHIAYGEKSICRKCFAHLHKFTVYEIETACTRLKEDINAYEFIKEKWEDRTLHPYNYSEINKIFEANCDIDDNLYTTGQPFDESMVADAGLPANDNDMNVALWLEDCFLTYGDSAPNRNIHQLSSTFKKDLWKLYYSEMSKIRMVPIRKPVDESRFNEIWNSCFPNYLVRPYANVVTLVMR